MDEALYRRDLPARLQCGFRFPPRPRPFCPCRPRLADRLDPPWVPGQWWDLIVTMDDATSEIYSAFFVDEEGTMSSFRALGEVIEVRGLFCSLYADRASHYWHTPEAGGKVDKDPGGPSPGPAGHRTDPGLLPRGPGALGAHVRDIAESPAAGTATLGRHHHDGRAPTRSCARFICPATTPVSRCRPKPRARPLSPSPDRSTTSCASRRTGSSATTTRSRATSGWCCRSRRIATAAITSRHRCGSTNTPAAPWRSSTARAGWPRYQADGTVARRNQEQQSGRVNRFDAACPA